MELTRRDAVAALATTGVAVGGGSAAQLALDGDDPPGPVAASQVATLVAAADVLYPDAVDDVEAFVRRYVRGLAAERHDHATGIASAADYLDAYAESWHGERFGTLDRETRDGVLREMGADVADPDPTGSDVERVRFHVVNELLFALYASPTGGELVGIENPQGHPGGLASYQRGPGA